MGVWGQSLHHFLANAIALDRNLLVMVALPAGMGHHWGAGVGWAVARLHVCKREESPGSTGQNAG